MLDALSAIYITVIGGSGLAFMFAWMVVAIISPLAAAVTFGAGCVLVFLGVLIETGGELCDRTK